MDLLSGKVNLPKKKLYKKDWTKVAVQKETVRAFPIKDYGRKPPAKATYSREKFMPSNNFRNGRKFKKKLTAQEKRKNEIFSEMSLSPIRAGNQNLNKTMFPVALLNKDLCQMESPRVQT